jgi:CheY-like chemotaxis protein
VVTAAKPSRATLEAGDGRVVLFVDDELSLLAVGKRRLESLGYVVHIAGTPAEALGVLADTDRHLDLLITDYSMPGMDGLEVGAAARRARPHLPVILLTGFIEDIAAEVLDGAGVKQVLRKPVMIEELSGACSSVLAASARRTTP